MNNSVHAAGISGLKIVTSLSNIKENLSSHLTTLNDFISYANYKGVIWKMNSNIRLKNFLLFDHKSVALEIFSSQSSQRDGYENGDNNFLENTRIIGNSESSSLESVSQKGIYFRQGGALLMKSVQFYNFPNLDSQAIAGTDECK